MTLKLGPVRALLLALAMVCSFAGVGAGTGGFDRP
jgi:hypothetical protein